MTLQSNIAPPGPEPAPGQAGARILLVDDDERNLLALTHALEDVAEVVTAMSGRDALRHLLHGDFAVVLLDVFMPDMDGYEVAELIRQRDQTARIPIIFLSAVNKEAEHLMRGYAMGAVDYVFKPVDAVILRSKVTVFVDLYLMRAQVEAKSRAEQEMREARFRAELERLQLEAELSSSRARLAAMLDVLPLAFYEGTADADGMLVRRFVGGDLRRLAGEQAEAIEAGTLAWEARIHPDDRKALPSLRDISADGRLSFEYRWLAGDGSTRHFIEHCVRMAGAGGWAGTLIDVTEQKRLEGQLLQAGKMDAIGQLTGGVAHDFNNLLATVLGGMRLLRRRITFEEREETIIDQMQLAAEKGAELVKRMMAFARKQDLHPVSIDPQVLCRSVGDLVEQTLGGTVTLEWDWGRAKRNFMADSSQLELALVNLILNARDATPGGGKVTVTIADATPEQLQAAKLPDRNYLSLRVSDQGTGIPPELLDKIAEPFFTTKAIGKGTGLGLSMTVGFVQQSNGRLTIESRTGESSTGESEAEHGTTITILLPSTAKAAEPAAPDAGEIKAPALSVRAVVLVDDDDMVRTVMTEQLMELGVSVLAFADARGAIAALACPEKPVDLLITDFAMPETNGLQAIAQATRIRPGLRSVIMTGYMDDALDADTAGGVQILRKPVPPEDLLRILA